MSYRFEPYIGKTYGKLEGHRLLILGESHYGNNQPDDEKLTNWVMDNWQSGEYSHAVLTKTAKLLTGHEAAVIRQQRKSYFNGCIFYNYIQDYVGEKHYSWNDPDFNRDTMYFEALIKEHAPTHILGWGWRLGEGMLKTSLNITRDLTIDGYRLTVGDVSCAMMFVTHPSARAKLNEKHSGRVARLIASYSQISPAAVFDTVAA